MSCRSAEIGEKTDQECIELVGETGKEETSGRLEEKEAAMSSQVAEVLNQSRTLAVKGELHESVALLLRKRFQFKQQLESQTGNLANQRATQSAIDVLSQRIDPLLQGLSSNVYEALGVPESANEADAKKAYRKLALRFHPDKSEGTIELFHCVQDAFERFQSGKNLKVNKASSSFSTKFKERHKKKSSTSSTTCPRKPSQSSSSTPLQQPQNARMVENSSTSITVSWDPPVGGAAQVSCYELQYKEAEERDWHVASNTLSRTSCQKHNLRPGVSYRFRIRALNAMTAEWSPFSSTCSASTMGAVPSRVTITRVTPKPNLLCFEVHWEPPTTANNSGDKYVLQWREKDKKMPWIESEVSNEYEASVCNRVVRDLKMSRVYQFRVRAKNHVGAGPWSVIVDSANSQQRPSSATNQRKIKFLKTRQYPDRHRHDSKRLHLDSWATWDPEFDSVYPHREE